MGRIKALFFDFDGTISDSRSRCYNTLTKILGERGYKFNQRKLKQVLGMRMPDILSKIGVAKSDIGQIRNEYFSRVAKLTNTLKPCTSLNPLKELKKSHKMVVMSNAKASVVKAAAKHLRLGRIFHEIYSSEKFSTKDKMLRMLFKKYKVKPSESAYIGDYFMDVDAARAAGCLSIAIHNACAYSSLSAVQKESPDFLIKDFRELKRLLEKIS